MLYQPALYVWYISYKHLKLPNIPILLLFIIFVPLQHVYVLYQCFILYCVIWFMLAWAIDLCLRVPLGWDFVTMATFPMASQIDLCIVCSRRVLQHMRRLYCNCCHRNVHKNCTGLWGEDFEIATQDTSWYCVTCMESLFAFNHSDDETDFLKAIADMSHQEASVQQGLRSKLFNPFEMNKDEHEILDYQGDLDSDKNYFNQYYHRLIKNCNYFLEESFKKHLSHHHIYSMKPSLCYI